MSSDNKASMDVVTSPASSSTSTDERTTTTTTTTTPTTATTATTTTSTTELEGAANPRGIPAALFIDSVDEFMANEASADAVLTRMNENYQKYKLMEVKVLQNKQRLQRSIPETKATLQGIEFLRSRSESDTPLTTQYELSEGLYAEAVIKQPRSVSLWLGANVMVEYTFDEAAALVQRNLDRASTNLTNADEDLDFLRDQITTTQVNIARVFNADVKRKRAERAAQEAAAGRSSAADAGGAEQPAQLKA